MSANEVVSTPSVMTPDSTSSATTSSPLAFNTVIINPVESDEVYATLGITLKDRPDTPATLRVKVDTGAPGNVMPLRTFQRMYPSDIVTEGIPARGSLEHRDTILTVYNGQLIRQYGTTRLKCVHETTTCKAEFFVIDTPGPVILGLPSCCKLNFVTLNCAVSEHLPPLNSKEDHQRLYPYCLKGIGKFRETSHITLDPAVTPVVHAPRRCPIHIKDDVSIEINQMVELGVIEKVEEPTDWESSIVYSRKSTRKLRICLYPEDLNTAIKRTSTHRLRVSSRSTPPAEDSAPFSFNTGSPSRLPASPLVIANSDTPTLNARCSQSSSAAKCSTCMSTENRSFSSQTTNLSR